MIIYYSVLGLADLARNGTPSRARDSAVGFLEMLSVDSVPSSLTHAVKGGPQPSNGR